MAAKRKANALDPLFQVPARPAKRGKRAASPKVVVPVALNISSPCAQKDLRGYRLPLFLQHATATVSKTRKTITTKNANVTALVFPQTKDHPFQTHFTKFLRLHGPDGMLQAENLEQEIGDKLARKAERKARKEESKRASPSTYRGPVAKVCKMQERYNEAYRSPYDNLSAEQKSDEVFRRFILAGAELEEEGEEEEEEEKQQELVKEARGFSVRAAETEAEAGSEEDLRNAQIGEWIERSFEESGKEAALARDGRAGRWGNKDM